MWQRIQTIWMILASIALVLFAVLDIATLTSEAGLNYVMNAWRLTPMAEQGGAEAIAHLPLGLLSDISLTLTLVSIFLYRRRMLQMRLLNLSALLALGSLGVMGYYLWQYTTESLSLSVRFAMCLPLVGLILQVMASRAVLRDETLIRMSNRLR